MEMSYENNYVHEVIRYKYISICSVLSVARIYHVYRFWIITSPYMSLRAQRVCKMNGAESNYSFYVKCYMKEYPLKFIFALLITGLLMGGYCIRIFEKPMSVYDVNEDFGEYSNSMWNMIITMTTVGYGDAFAVTLPGRIVAFIFCI